MPRKIEILVVLVVLVVGCSLVQRREQPPLLDSDGDGDADGDSDSDGDSDTDGDGDADVDGDADGDTDSDTDGDGDCPDNDSDGHTDEACGGDDWDDTNPTVYPDAPELCDDLDNDGDGTVDEGVNDCGGACLITANTPGSPCDGPDTDLCEDDAYECDGLNATVCADCEENAEICNEEDDNCDGPVDEGCACSDGDDRPCGKDEGECVAGTQTCDETGSWSGCAGEIGPIDEACNTLDDDCNGEVDEGENACGGVCELADRPDSPCDGSDSDLCADDVYECDELNETVCSAGADNVETCNGLDDDCDPATGCSCSGTAPDVPVAGLYISYYVPDRDREVGGPILHYMIAPEGGAGLWEEGEGCTFDGCSLLCPLIPVPAGRCVYFNIEVEGRAYPWACGPGGSDTYGRVGVYVDGTYRSNSTSSPAPGGPLGRRGCDFIACPSG